MDLIFTAEQDELRRTVRALLSSHCPMSVVREWMEVEHDYDRGLWRRMATGVGMQGIAVPEEFGGAGYGVLELIGVFEEMGAALVPVPFLSTVALGTAAILASRNDEAQRRWLPLIADGSAVATVTMSAVSRGAAPSETAVTANEAAGHWRLTGTAKAVLDGAFADVVVVKAQVENGFRLFTVDMASESVSSRSVPTLDQTRKSARIDFVKAPAQVITDVEDTQKVLEAMEVSVAVALAAEQVGVAQRCLDISVDYAKVRNQFGRAIGSFQAIKHRCADMHIRLEAARSSLYLAGWAASRGDAESVLLSEVALTVCAEAAFENAKAAIQIHGGMGHTWEHDAHLYLKRAAATRMLVGDPGAGRARIGQRIGLGAWANLELVEGVR